MEDHVADRTPFTLRTGTCVPAAFGRHVGGWCDARATSGDGFLPRLVTLDSLPGDLVGDPGSVASACSDVAVETFSGSPSFRRRQRRLKLAFNRGLKCSYGAPGLTLSSPILIPKAIDSQVQTIASCFLFEEFDTKELLERSYAATHALIETPSLLTDHLCTYLDDTAVFRAVALSNADERAETATTNTHRHTAQADSYATPVSRDGKSDQERSHADAYDSYWDKLCDEYPQIRGCAHDIAMIVREKAFTNDYMEDNDFVVAVLDSYMPSVPYWGISDEPTLEAFWAFIVKLRALLDPIIQAFLQGRSHIDDI